MPGFDELWFNRVEALRDDANQQVSDALRRAGWEHTSNTPGSYWMWQKEIDGKFYSVSQEAAARIQEHADRYAYFDKFPDEMGD